MKTTLYMYYGIIIFVILPVYAAYPISTLYAESLGASLFQISIMNVFFSILPLCIAISAGKIIDQFGEKLPLIIGMVGMMITLLLPFLFESIWALFVMKFFLGGSQLLGILASQNGVQKVVMPEGRNKTIANFSLFSSLGMLLGPLVGTYVGAIFNYRTVYLVLATMCTIPLVCSLLLHPTEVVKSEVNNKSAINEVKEVLKRPGLTPVLIISMLSLSTLDIFYVYFPLYAKSIGLTVIQIGWVLSIQALCNALTRMFLDRFIQWIGYMYVLLVALLLGVISFGALIMFDHIIYILLIASLLGVGLGIIQPLTTTLTFNFAPDGRTGLALGIRLTGNRVGQICIPLVFGSISGITGIGGLFVISSISLLMGAVITKKFISNV